MGCDTVVALGRATVDGCTFFGHNTSWPTLEFQPLCRTPGRSYALGENLRAQHISIPQTRQTHAVLGSQRSGMWGYVCGVNECGVAAGCARLHSALPCSGPGLTGPDLVRLVLERSHTAAQAVDHLTDLIERHGQGAHPDCPREAEYDHAFLIADAREAYAAETAGKHWVYQQVREVRVMSESRIIRQDWNRISRGLAGHMIERGWWPADGSKLDFAGALGEKSRYVESTLNRWGRGTLLLQEQNGHIDLAFARRVLSDHDDDGDLPDTPERLAEQAGALCRHGQAPWGETTVSSFLAVLPNEPARPVMGWSAFGPPCLTLFFPVFLEGELPAAFAREVKQPGRETFWGRLECLAELMRADPDRGLAVREGFARLQARFDQEAEEFVIELQEQRSPRQDELCRQATLFMQHHVECFEEVLKESLRMTPLAAAMS